MHPVIKVLKDRSAGKSDDNKTALVIEAGATKGAITAGMLIELIEQGIGQECFDAVYACSVGAFNALYLLSGNDISGAKVYTSYLDRRFFNPYRMLAGKPVIDIDYLINDICSNKLPINWQKVVDLNKLHLLVTDPRNLKPVMLSPAKSVAELKLQIKATCHLALAMGRPPKIDGQVLFDGSLAAPLPFESAIEDGATHILNLSSRHLRDWRTKQKSLEKFATWIYDLKYKGVHRAIRNQVEMNEARSLGLINSLENPNKIPFIFTAQLQEADKGKSFELRPEILNQRIEQGRKIMAKVLSVR